MNKRTIAFISYDIEGKKWEATYLGKVAEQGGSRIGLDTIHAATMEQLLDGLKQLMLNFGEENYIAKSIIGKL